MTKKEIEYEEEVEMLNHLIAHMNGRGKALKVMLDEYNRDYANLKKRLEKHFKKYGIEANDDTK